MNDIYKNKQDIEFDKNLFNEYDESVGIVLKIKDFNDYEKPIELFFDNGISESNKSLWKKTKKKLDDIAKDELKNISSTASMLINNITQMYLQKGVGFINKKILEYKSNVIRYVTDKLNINPYEGSNKPTTTFYNELKDVKQNYNESIGEIIEDINNFLFKKNDVITDDNDFLSFRIKESDLYKQTNSPIYYKSDKTTGEKFSFLGYLNRYSINEDTDIFDKLNQIKQDESNLKDIYKISKDNWSSYSTSKKTYDDGWTDKQLEFLREHGVEFILHDIISDKVIYFDNTISSLTDSTSVNRTERRISGRPDSYRIYAGTSRSGNLNFSVVASSIDMLKSNMEKLNSLDMMCKPTFNNNNRPVNPFIKVTIGNFLKDQMIKINSLIINPDEEMGWKVRNNNDEVSFPYKVDVTIDYTIIYEKTPNYNENFNYFNK